MIHDGVDGKVFCSSKGSWGKFTPFGHVIEGILSKKSSSKRMGSKWQKRYFMLSEGLLSYWHTDKLDEKGSRPTEESKDHWSISDIKEVAMSGKDPSRMLITLKSKEVHLKAEVQRVTINFSQQLISTALVCTAWIKALQAEQKMAFPLAV
jgi:hypothetical protein